MLPLEIIFNAVVFLVFFAYWVVAFIILYHLTRFGIGVQPKRFSAIFIFVSLILTSLSLIIYANLDLGSIFS